MPAPNISPGRKNLEDLRPREGQNPLRKGKRKKNLWIQNEISGNDLMILSSFREDGYVKLNSAWQAALSYSLEVEEEKEKQ